MEGTNKKKRAALHSKINFVSAQLKSIHNAGKVKSLSSHVIPSRKRITIELAKLKLQLNPPKTVHALPAKKERRMHVTRIMGPIFPTEKRLVHY